MIAEDKMYDTTLPSDGQFMYIESKREITFCGDGELRVIAFGAYNAFGLIGPEMGGVAVIDIRRRSVVARKTVAHSSAKRDCEFTGTVKLLEDYLKEFEPTDDITVLANVQTMLRCRGYGEDAS